MPLSPLDIHNKEFAKTFRGYDEDEVNEFLDLIIKDYETLIRDNKELTQKVASLQEQLNHFANIEDTLGKTLLHAQETAEELKNNANIEAKLIRKTAEKNANQIIEDAVKERTRIQNQILVLKRETSAFRTRLLHAVQAQLDILNSPEWSDAQSFAPLDFGQPEVLAVSEPAVTVPPLTTEDQED